MTTDNDDTAAQASIEDAGDAGARADAQVRAVLGRVMAQRRSAGTALDYVRELAPGVKANCWGLAEAAGHESPYRMQALLRSCRWDWKDLRAELPALARAWLPCDPGDLTGPGIAVDETAQLKDGDATACVAPQHAGCTGHVENCVTTVFSAWVTTSGQAWADFDVFMPERWEKDWRRRRAARIPGGLGHKTETAAGHRPAGAAAGRGPAREMGGVRRGVRPQRRAAPVLRVQETWRTWRSSPATSASPCRPAPSSGVCQKFCAGGGKQERFRRPQGVAATMGRSR